MSDETETVDPAQTAADEGAGDALQQQEPAAEPQPRMVPLDTFTREVTPLRARNRDLEAALEEHRRRDAAQQELIARLQNGGDASAPQQRQGPQVTDEEVTRRAMQLNFTNDAQYVSNKAGSAYGQQWVNSLNILGTFNLNTPDVVSHVMEIAGRDRTHEVMHEIGQNPELAASLASMSPVRRVAEISKIAERMNTKAGGGMQTQTANAAQPPARTVSRAPAPAPSIQPSASKVKDWRADDASDEEFNAGFNETFLKRVGRR